MHFIEFYNSISDTFIKRNIRKKIITECEIQPSTFYSWINKRKFPLPARQKISEIIGKPEKELFPDEFESTLFS